ncbi:Sorting nexin C terminal [Musa troglodytarum]|uniref:Sorting nexin C terminal n=1 Tax=Musa troglodytarum TaxID=320322 RepID=A0A9E7KB95_9LILI|nr:Sorting nexin C terminal [Musa troglodytarum]
MRAMETLQDLIEEAKVRTVCWAICVFAISYFLSLLELKLHLDMNDTSKSMWTNVPISVLILVAFRVLSYDVELRWRVRPIPRQTYLSHLEKKQLRLEDSRLSAVVPTSRWKRKFDSPLVEAAIEEFINKIMQDFVIDLWYSSISPDKEAPELIRSFVLDVLGEISGRVKQINLVDLLTRDLIDLVGNQLDLYRKNQSEIGVNVMITLSLEERDERLKRHLMASKELHPALFSPETEYKVLQRIVGGVLSLALKPREAQCPLVRCLCRELLTCLVVQPVMKFASPGYINELIEYMFLNNKDSSNMEVTSDRSLRHSGQNTQSCQLGLVQSGGEKLTDGSELSHPYVSQKDSLNHISPRPADWAMVLEATTKRRTEVLAPENLENMWTKGRNYQKKTANLIKTGTPQRSANTTPGCINSTVQAGSAGKELVTYMSESVKGVDENYMVHLTQGVVNNEHHGSYDPEKGQYMELGNIDGNEKYASKSNNNIQLKRSSSTPDMDAIFKTESDDGTSFKEKCHIDIAKHKEVQSSEVVSHSEGSLHLPKIKCRVVGAYFEKLGSKSFAVYSIAVTDLENKTWFVKRRHALTYASFGQFLFLLVEYRNFERLHRHLKDIPNYSLHLPPKRFLSSSIDDYFVHQRCILLDKYLQDLLSIANVAEQHEVWDFLSVSSKNYSCGKSTSVVKTLAVNVDDAMDDVFCQFKGSSDGLMCKVAGTSPSHATSPSVADKVLSSSWNPNEISKQISGFSSMETSHSLSEDEAHDDDRSTAANNGWHSDNELNSKSFPPRVFNRIKEYSSLESQQIQESDKFDRIGSDVSKNSLASDILEDPVGMPPEWAPPNVSVPMLNLVDKIFQLNRRGWLRRQVYWISKQILQLIMEDAIDDWILRQIHWLRRDDVIAQGIRWVQDVLWPNGTFIIRLASSQGELNDFNIDQKPSQSTSGSYGDKVTRPSSFEAQLEAARRADDVKKMLLGGAPTALVSLIGSNQYRRCARDIYYFSQSTICIKQLAYSMLEMVLVSVFPELRDVMLDIHDKVLTNGK